MPIRWRLTLFNGLLIGAILLFLGLFVYLVLREALYSGVEDTVRARATEASRAFEAGKTPSRENLERYAAEGVYVVARDGEGRVLDRWGAPVSRGALEADDVWRRALSSGGPAGGEVDTPERGEDHAYAVPVDPPAGSPVGTARVVEAGKSYGEAEETLETLAAATAAGLLAALLLSAGGAYVLARAALAPVDAVVRSAQRVTEGDLGRRLPVANPKDEIGRLASTVNGLLSRLQAAFARREEALAEREEALSRQRRFASDAGHDLRTPLTSIAGQARLLERWGLEDPEAARKSVAAIRREAERMEGLVEDLLALARGDEGAPLNLRPQDLGAVASEAVEEAHDAAKGKVAVEYLPPDGPVVAAFDRGLVHRAAAALLDNAVKHTPEGGRVRAEVREEDGWALLAVSDTGAGIPEEHLPRVFERFYRADSARAEGGAGLGLAIARQVVEAHGGAVEVASEPGEGSSFTLRIPKDGPSP